MYAASRSFLSEALNFTNLQVPAVSAFRRAFKGGSEELSKLGLIIVS